MSVTGVLQGCYKSVTGVLQGALCTSAPSAASLFRLSAATCVTRVLQGVTNMLQMLKMLQGGVPLLTLQQQL
jgi:hypothetical protein